MVEISPPATDGSPTARPSSLALAAAAAMLAAASGAETWRGLTVGPENRCAVYDADDYAYPAALEQRIVERQGGVFSPYTLRRFDGIRETDIEHVVARSEAHDSGLCARSKDARRAFANDLDNLTLAAPYLNRNRKGHRDPAEWMPNRNRCWYARTWVRVKRKWQLSVDVAERDALEAVLGGCRQSSRMEKPATPR